MTFEQRAKYMPGVAPRYSSRQQRQFGRGLIRIYLLEGDKILAPSLAKAAVATEWGSPRPASSSRPRSRY